MNSKVLFIVGALLVFSALCIAGRAASQSTPKPAAALPATQQPSGQSGYVLKVTTRLVTVDVVAVDSRGNPVRDLKPEELQVFEEHKVRQKIEHFEFIEKMKGAVDAAMPDGVLSNQLPIDQLKVPPTALLLDSLNTQSPNQLQGRAHMIQLLRTLPPDTPVAVFLLGASLQILQGFTSDPALLRAALDESVSATTVSKDHRDDSQSASSLLQNSTVGVGRNMGLASQRNTVQNFEMEEYASSVDLRARDTLAAMAQIAQYLSGIPGRKNLIWVSESFPISIAPDTSSGNNTFAGLRDYTELVKNVANALTDAQVAVYPMDVRGLQAQQSLTASQPAGQPRMRGPDIAGMLNHEDTELQSSQGTMEELASDTGGEPCKNRNDLSGCLTKALKDSSSYYEMSFYPQNVNWDGRFHRITVRTTRSGLKLSYRRGYYALDASSLARQLPPEAHLRQACADQLPSTTIPLAVRAVPAGEAGAADSGLQYLLAISPAGLGALQPDGSYNFNVRVADCEFAQKDTIFRFNERAMPNSVPGDVYRGWQSTGIPYHMVLKPSEGTRRIRLAVLDVSSGLTGAIDVPVTAEEIAKATASVAPATPVAPPAPVAPPPPAATTPYVELPDKVKGDSPPKILASLTFHLGASASGTLDWSRDSLDYDSDGDMPLDKAAGGFFTYAFGDRFHCQNGHFVPLDPGDADPLLRVTFHNYNGKLVVVDLKGDQPLYLGDLPVDPGAQSFFSQVWKSSHCQAQ